MAASFLGATSRKRWRRRRARHAVRPTRPTGLRFHPATWLACLAVAWSLWYQVMHVGFGEWIGPKIAPPAWAEPGSNAPKYRAPKRAVRGTYLVNGRNGALWPKAISPGAAAAGVVAQPYEDHLLVRTILLTAAAFLVVCTGFAVEQWAHARFQITIMTLLVVTTIAALAFSLYLPLAEPAWVVAVRLPTFLAIGICPYAWLLATRSVMRRMSAVA